MKNPTFLSNTLLLTASAILCKVIGALYKIPLTNVLGSEGMGLYQLIFPLYALLITLTSGGIPATMASISSMDDREIVRAGLSYTVAVSTALSIALYLLAPILSSIEGNSLATMGYRAIAPSVLCSGIIATMRGYFMRKLSMAPTSISQLIEQVVKLIVGLSLSIYLVPRGVEWGVVGALLGITVAEAVATLYLVVLYLIRRPSRTPNSPSARYSIYRLATYTIPITLGSLIVPLSGMLDSLLVVNILSPISSISEATSLYGIYSASVSSIINVPIVVAVSIATAILPSVAKITTRGDRDSLSRHVNVAIKYSYIVSLLATLLLVVSAPYVIDTLYPVLSTRHRAIASNLLVLSSISIVPLSTSNIYTAILQGLGVPSVNVKILTMGTVVKLISTIALLPRLGIYGSAIGGALCYTVTHLLSMHYVRDFLKKSDYLVKTLCKITLSGVIILVVTYLLVKVSYYLTIPAVIAGVIGYVLILRLIGVVNINELKRDYTC